MINTSNEPQGFSGARKEAETLAQDKEKSNGILEKAMEKARERKDLLARAWDELWALIRMLRAWVKGEYKEIPWRTIVLSLGAIIYFVNPIDFLPDLLPFIGFADDITVIGFVFSTIRKDIKKFMDWEDKHGMNSGEIEMSNNPS